VRQPAALSYLFIQTEPKITGVAAPTFELVCSFRFTLGFIRAPLVSLIPLALCCYCIPLTIQVLTSSQHNTTHTQAIPLLESNRIASPIVSSSSPALSLCTVSGNHSATVLPIGEFYDSSGTKATVEKISRFTDPY
jgi:hypothetical protein